MKPRPPLPELALPVLDFGGSAARPLPSLPGLGLELPGAQAAEEEDPVAATERAILDLSTFAGRAQAERDRFVQATDSEYWVCLCFETREQKEEFLRRLQLGDLGDKHIDGIETARRLGIPLASPRADFRERKVNPKLAAIAVEPEAPTPAKGGKGAKRGKRA